MPGQQLKNTWAGNRAELLAIYNLSSIAAVTHIRRENDFGFDLLCTLLSQENNVLRAGHLFGVQVRSSKKSKLCYGGLDKNQNWKDYEIKWLFNQDLPFLILIIDSQKGSINLYNTSRIWYLLYQIGPNPGEVILLPDMELPQGEFTPLSDQWRYIDKPLKRCANGNMAGNGFSYQVPLGKPIIKLSGENDNQNEIKTTLANWLSLENYNILNRKLGVPNYLEWESWGTNNSIRPKIITGTFWNDDPGANILKLLESISPSIESLLLHLLYQNNIDKAKAATSIAHWLKEEGLLGKIGIKALQDIEQKIK